jgi:hypothetical protein
MLPKKLNTAFVALAFMGLQSQAQLTIQSGATFNMQSGALVTVQGSVDNAGSLGNEGSLKVQGNYINTGTYSATAGVLEMYGTGNSDMNAGSSPIANLVINKTNPTDIVKLTATAIVNNSLTHTNGVFTTDPIANPSFSITSPVTATYTFAAGKEIVGSVKRTSWTAGAARVFNQPNMLVTTNGGTTPTDFTVTMIPQSGGGDPTQAEREVTRKYTFAQTGGSGFTADVRYPYITSELNTNNENNLVPWRLAAAEWNARLTPVSRDGVNDYVSTTGIPATEMTQEWKLADPNYTMNLTTYIKGAWNNPTGLMRVTINANALLPLSQPYTGAPFLYAGTESVGAIPNANIVDWVLLELRKPSTGLPADANASTTIGRKAAFLLNNGSVVDLDGVTAAQMAITKQGSGNFIVVRHRNHLSAMSITKASNATGDFANDFSLLANVYEKPAATSQPISLLATTAPGNTKYGLWPGDVNANGNVTPSDVTPINIAISGPVSGNTSVYNVRDANLDRNVTPADVSVTNSSVSGFAQSSSSRSSTTIITNPTNPRVKIISSHVPGESKSIE